MTPPAIYSLLSETSADECHVPVLLRKHTCRYVDEGNWHMVPSAEVEAGVEIAGGVSL